ncbi:DUF2625 domain-containing protein [Gelidibacter mesophilus]|uniref:DUF2625 domain-containing protein n=1 Tax=Gelidibacter mesophilus TaxID=169050 RepID=UPI0003FB936A|nr:DUF2625 domain-containing protein [Gelidibacter mesophilus]
MKHISELINNVEPGWELVSNWINDATNKIEILPKNEKQANESLYQTQVTTRSPMGAIIYETGGILIDNGWIRILGSGNQKLDRTLPNWNKGKTFNEFGEQPSIFLIADDVVGGFFGINGGALGEDLGKIYYFAPDSLEWEPMDIGYSDFLWWTFNGDLSEFYKNVRWTNWEKEITEINGNLGYSFYPFLWTEYDNIDELNRKAVPISEIWELQQEFAEQLKTKE